MLYNIVAALIAVLMLLEAPVCSWCCVLGVVLLTLCVVAVVAVICAPVIDDDG